MKFYYAIILSLFTACIYSEEITKKEIIPTTDDPNYGKVERIIFSYNIDRDLVSDEVIYTESFSKERNIFKQVTIYENGSPFSFEMFYLPEYSKITNVLSRIDYVDKNDNMVGVSYIDTSKYKWNFSSDSLKTALNFNLSTFDSFFQIFNEYGKLKENESAYENKTYSGFSLINKKGKHKPLNQKEKAFISGYFKMTGNEPFALKYCTKIEVNENGRTFNVFLQDVHSDIDSYNPVFLYYYYIGGNISGPFFLGIGFYENARK